MAEHPSEVAISPLPWVSGTRAVAHFGPIACAVFLEAGEAEACADALEKALEELLERLRGRTREIGANAIVGVEIDPFAVEECSGRRGCLFHALGTGALLRSLS